MLCFSLRLGIGQRVEPLAQTKSVGWVPLEQSPEEGLGFGAQELRHSQARPAGGVTAQ